MFQVNIPDQFCNDVVVLEKGLGLALVSNLIFPLSYLGLGHGQVQPRPQMVYMSFYGM